jgi:hypothetical protein
MPAHVLKNNNDDIVFLTAYIFWRNLLKAARVSVTRNVEWVATDIFFSRVTR